MTTFRGALLRARCEDQGLRLEELAIRTGLSWGYLYQLTRDLKQPSTRTLGLITDALHCQVGDLFAADDAQAVPW
jgi:transcriptional regulator with XRE-family HTH domain